WRSLLVLGRPAIQTRIRRHVVAPSVGWRSSRLWGSSWATMILAPDFRLRLRTTARSCGAGHGGAPRRHRRAYADGRCRRACSPASRPDGPAAPPAADALLHAES